MSHESHARHEENMPAYVLNALPELERTALERHLEHCHACRQELARLQPPADTLARAVTPLTPPPRLKQALMREVEADVHERQTAVDRPRRRLRLLPARPALAWGLAAALIALGAVAGYGLSQLGGDDSARTVTARVDSSRLPGARASLVVPSGGGRAVLRLSGLPLPARGRVYQLWLLKDGSARPESLFSADRDGRATAALSDALDRAQAVMVTREPAGGSDQPSEQPVLSVKL